MTHPHNSRCKALAKSGQPCGAAATEGGLSFFHANPNKAAELGPKGGRRKAHTAESAEPLPAVDNAIAVRDLVARLIVDVHAGKVPSKIAAGLAPLMHLQLRAITTIEISNLGQRLAKVEEELAAQARRAASK